MNNTTIGPLGILELGCCGPLRIGSRIPRCSMRATWALAFPACVVFDGNSPLACFMTEASSLDGAERNPGIRRRGMNNPTIGPLGILELGCCGPLHIGSRIPRCSMRATWALTFPPCVVFDGNSPLACFMMAGR